VLALGAFQSALCFLAVISGFSPVNHRHFPALCGIAPAIAE
jgi:hypothetical protein